MNKAAVTVAVAFRKPTSSGNSVQMNTLYVTLNVPHTH